SFLKVCDFGPYRKFIIPPDCITLETKRAGVRFRKSHVITVRAPSWEPWTPLIVLGNRKSGNGDGSHILSTFRRLLNPLQVVDLADKSPEEALQWVSLMPSSGQTLILAAGGDGTAAWILNTIHNMKLDPAPSVGIIPLGTGNDLSRVLGWGKLYDRDTCSLIKLLHKTPMQIDGEPWLQPPAMITLSHVCQCTVCEMLLMNNLNEYYCDCCGVCADLKCIPTANTSIQCKQISIVHPKHTKMKHLWTKDSEDGMGDSLEQDQKIDDSKIEVMALYSSFHIARLQVGLSEPLKLGQVSQVKVCQCAVCEMLLMNNLNEYYCDCCGIKLLHKTPMQIDGEPWLQPPAMITLSHVDKANFLYLTFGTQQAMERGCRDLDQRIELYLDGERVDLPPIESVVVLNIPSWASGVDLWKLGRDSEDGMGDSLEQDQNIDDSKIEVMALYSSFHIARLQVGLSEPLKLGQVSQVKRNFEAE
ncbi:diacylglycerol kinase epsilon, partial [Diaphorina citri]|uniref:Diacylglycerol kinase n=1 Tax=Diaphorina citri TaxID=121845 RepID=A0A3Q0IXL6_DIACI